MKILVKLGVSQDTDNYSFTLEELGFECEEDWLELSEEQKKEIIEREVLDINNQPFWMLDSFTED